MKKHVIARAGMTDLPFATVERIMRNAGAEWVSMDAVVALVEILEEYKI